MEEEVFNKVTSILTCGLVVIPEISLGHGQILKITFIDLYLACYFPGSLLHSARRVDRRLVLSFLVLISLIRCDVEE